MKKTLLALFALAIVPTVSFAQTMTIGSATGPQGGAAAPLPVAITFTNVAGAGAVVDIDSRLTYDSTKLTIVPTSAAPGACSVQAPGTIFVTVPGTGPAIASGVICNLTAINIAGAAALGATPLTLVNGAGSGCSNAAAVKVPCGYSPGMVTITMGATANTPPTLGALAAATLSGGVSPAGTGTVAVPVATAGTAVASVATACSIPAGANAFTVTSGAALTFTAPAAVPGTATVGVSCNRTVAAATGVLTCTQTATPAGAALPNLTSTVTCPALPAGATITPNLLGGTAAAPVTLNIANGSAQPVGTVINVNGLTVTGAGFVAPAVGSWGACTYSADATPPAATTSDPTAFTAGAQLVFNAANNGTAQPQVLGATRRAGQVSAILTCPVLPAGTAPGATANVYRLLLAAGVVPATTVTATLASGPLTLPAFTVGAGSSSSNLTFTGTAGGSVACAFNPAAPGYTATPNPLTLTGTTPGTVAVTYTGAVAGTFTGTLVCNVAAPGTGGPFTYNVSTTVNGVVVPQIQVPALGNISLMLLIAGFLGLGVVLVGRRQA